MRASNGRWVRSYDGNKKRCPACNEVKPLNEFYIKQTGKQRGQPMAYCKGCTSIRGQAWRLANKDRVNAVQLARKHRNGESNPMEDNIDCSSYLGIHIAERVLSRYFDNIIVMPHNNPGYDFVCGKGFKIDAKSGCLRHGVRGNPRWAFTIRRNSKADYFICLGFKDRQSLEPLHVWLIPRKDIGNKYTFGVSNSPKMLAKWSKYEKPLDRAVSCCEAMRSKA